MIRKLVLFVSIAIVCSCSNGWAEELPKYFTYLRDVDPSIQQDVRYATPYNFIGEQIDGYEAPECVLTTRAAKALAQVQTALKKQDLSLKVYDCYRPQRAVDHFVRWAGDLNDKRMKPVFYPEIPKDRLLKGYISSRSTHSRGSTVDLTIVPLDTAQPDLSVVFGFPIPCTAPKAERWPDNSLDMGTAFDCFDERSHTANRDIPEAAQANRELLVDLMTEAGFENYRREWWHFQLKNEPYRQTRFDFPIVAPPAEQSKN